MGQAEVHHIEDAHACNLTRLAEALGCHRATVRKVIREHNITPVATKRNVPVYRIKDVAPAVFAPNDEEAETDPEKLSPTQRNQWYQSERARMELERELRNLVSVEEATRDMSALAKTVASALDGLADVLERDAGLTPEQVSQVQEVTDSLREQMYEAIASDDGE